VVGVDEVVLVVEVTGVMPGGHDSEMLLAGPGRFSDESGAPGASW